MAITLPTPSTRLLKDLDDNDFAQFKELIAQNTDRSQFPLCDDVVERVVVYSSKGLLPLLRGTAEDKNAVMDEIQRALQTGPGVLVIRDMIPCDVVDRASKASEEINPKPANSENKNSRRTFAYSEKHAKHDPESFADYYGNEILSAVCEAWLGPSYQVTATINATFKGGIQQEIHRDYHVSHQAMDRIRRIPVVNQIASQYLTLQSAIAHTDMPKSTGPTRFTPYSQLFEKGYTAVKDPRYIECVSPQMVQLELNKGDAVFFNPATFHQPGVNITDDERVANLLQVSSPFGRSMESCDRLSMTKAVWPVIKRWSKEIAAGSSSKTPAQLDALIAATCSDYGYPKVIDFEKRDGPETQAGVVRKALEDGTEDAVVYEILEKHQSWHLP